MSQTVQSTTTSPDGMWTTTIYSDGSTSFGPTASNPIAIQQTNLAALVTKAQTALMNNTTFIGQAKPSTASAQASQTYDQAVALSRQVDAIIRLLLAQVLGDQEQLNSTTGT